MTEPALKDRIRLAHAALQATADECGAEILHIKGYATAEGFYRPARRSSDADILVRPQHVPRLVRGLEARGWRVATHFESGSAFGHAMTLHHDWWGSVDLHRYFPGITLDADAAFDLLWADRMTYPIAHFPCHVPSYRDQVLLILLHTGRDGQRGREDLGHLQRVTSAADMAELRVRAGVLGSDLGLAAALGDLDQYRDRPEYRLWKVMSEGGTRLQEWRARLSAAPDARSKIGVLVSMMKLNRDHLAVTLGREPNDEDVRRARAERRSKALAEVRIAVGRAVRSLKGAVRFPRRNS